MDILIKDMQMPTGDEMLCINIFPDGKVTSHFDLRCAPVAKAVPVPPHGRLGELDKLENGLRHMAKYQHGERQQGILGCCETIRSAPTIIEASCKDVDAAVKEET